MLYRKSFMVIAVAVLGLLVFVPNIQAERLAVEGTSCCANTINIVQAWNGQIYLGSYEGKCIYRGTTANEPAENTSYQVGILKATLQGPTWHGLQKAVDKDGDFIYYEFTGDRKSGTTVTLISGTGKYKGAKGEMKVQNITTAKPIAPDTDLYCAKVTGWIELATVSSVKPIRDFKDVAGTWEGKYSGSGWSTPMKIVINDDGSGYVSVPKDSVIFSGSDGGRIPMKRELVDGKIRVKNLIAGTMSTTTLHEEGGKRFLKAVSDDGNASGVFERAK